MPAHIICLSGPEGVGKDSIMRELLAKAPWLRVGQKATTRAARPDDLDPETGLWKYNYVSFDEFMHRRQLGEIVEHSQNATGGFYGSQVDFDDRTSVEIRDIDVNGALQLAGKAALNPDFPRVTPIGIIPPTHPHPELFQSVGGLQQLFRGTTARLDWTNLLVDEMRDTIAARLSGRGDKPEIIEQKLARAVWEIPEILRTWLHVVINDDLSAAVDRAGQIVQQVAEAEAEFSSFRAHSV